MGRKYGQREGGGGASGQAVLLWWWDQTKYVMAMAWEMRRFAGCRRHAGCDGRWTDDAFHFSDFAISRGHFGGAMMMARAR